MIYRGPINYVTLNDKKKHIIFIWWGMCKRKVLVTAAYNEFGRACARISAILLMPVTCVWIPLIDNIFFSQYRHINNVYIIPKFN